MTKKLAKIYDRNELADKFIVVKKFWWGWWSGGGGGSGWVGLTAVLCQAVHLVPPVKIVSVTLFMMVFLL